jgi:hypothetical protein
MSLANIASSTCLYGRKNKFNLIFAAITILLLGHAMLVLVPWQPFLPRVNLDSSWLLINSYAFKKKWLYGKDIIWPYGPLGFLFGFPIVPESFVALLIGRSIMAVSLFSMYFFTIGISLSSVLKRCMWWLAVLATMNIWFDTPFFGFSLLLFFVYFFRSSSVPTFLIILLSALTALSGLVKISFLLAAFFIQTMIALDSILVKKKLPALLIIFVATYLLGWLALQQKLDFLPTYFFSSSALSRGFSAMSITGRSSEIIGFLVCWILLEILIVNQLWQRQPASAIIGAMTFFGVFFFIFKAGFTRHDGHAEGCIAALLLFSLLFFLQEDNWRFFLPGKMIAAICIGAQFIVAIVTLHNHGNDFKRFERAVIEPVPMAKGFYNIVSGKYSYTNQYTATMEEISIKYQLPPLAGTVDLYPSNQTLILANGFQYDPRPIFQSYSSYTPTLLEKNAEHLRGLDAPQHILFEIMPTDQQYPSLADGLSWPELLTRYSAEGLYGNYLILNKRPKKLNYHFELFEVVKPDFGESIELPRGVSIWARISMPLTYIGDATEFLFKLPITEIRIVSGKKCRQQTGFDEQFYLSHYPDVANAVREGIYISGFEHYNKFGRKEKRLVNNNNPFRLVPGMAKAGFLLSPFIDTGKDFSSFSKSGMAALEDKQVCSMEINFQTGKSWEKNLLFKKPQVELFKFVTN